jgi:hypothetical protein
MVTDRNWAGRRVARRSRTLRRVLVTASLALTLPQASCYTYGAAYQGRLVPGTRMAFALNDRGRAALGDQIGSRVLQVEGTLLQDNGSSYLVSVAAINTIDGGRSRWGGERITMSHGDVESIRRRDFSRGKTAAAIAVATVGIAAFIISRNLSVFGIGPSPTPDPPNPPNQ